MIKLPDKWDIEEVEDKPEVQLTGEDGNVFSIMGRVSKALKRAGKSDDAKRWQDLVMSSNYDYNEIIGRLVNYFADVS